MVGGVGFLGAGAIIQSGGRAVLQRVESRIHGSTNSGDGDTNDDA